MWRKNGWNVPYLGKETNVQIQKTSKIPKKMNWKRAKPRHIKIKLSKVRQKENPKNSKRTTTYYIQGNPHKCIGFFSRHLAGQKREEWYIQSTEREREKKKTKNPTTKNTLTSKVVLQNWNKDKEFSRQTQVEEFHHH